MEDGTGHVATGQLQPNPSQNKVSIMLLNFHRICFSDVYL